MAWLASATLLNGNALKWWPYWDPPPTHVPYRLRSTHLCYLLFHVNVIRLCREMLFWRTFDCKYYHKPSKMCITVFVHMVYWLNHILNESELKLKNTNFLTRVLQHNKLCDKRISIIGYFQTHCQLSKFTIRDMPFKTKLTSLVNTRGLTESASLKIIRIMAITLGAITDLNIFGGV